MKKILALLLTLAMAAALFAGCGSKPAAPAEETPAEESQMASTATESAPAEQSQQPAKEESATPAEEPAASAEEPTVPEQTGEVYEKFGITFNTYSGNPSEAEQVPVSLPVTQAEASASLYMIFSPAVISYVGQLADENIAWKTFCEKTGLQLDIHLVHPGQKSTEVSLMLASQDYYDIMQDVISKYTGGGDQAIDDDFVYDLTDMLQENAPNFWAKMIYNQENYEKVATETGRLVGFSRISSELRADKGMIVRQDWLDELGLETPSTIDEFHNMLAAFTDSFGTDSPLWMPGSAMFMNDEILSAYYGAGDFLVKDGQVIFGVTDDSFKQYLRTLAQWYSEGLIYSDFYINTDDKMVEDISLIASHKMGVAYTETAKIATFDKTVEGSQWAAISAPVVKAGDVLHTGGSKAYYCDMVDLSITTNCKIPETVCAAFDYLYTDEGSLLANYGVEGVTFEYNAEGEPAFTELITSDPNYDLKTQIMLNCFDIGPYVKDVYRTSGTETANQKAAYGIWYSGSENDMAWCLPDKVTLTTDESNEVNLYYAEYNTYYLETVSKFIMGTESLDNWDEYVSTMNELGAEKTAAIYQAAYERYMGN